jgi:catechol-2,3-dioxygenase
MTYPTFVDHLVLRLAEVGRTERFYTALLGQARQRAEGSIMYQVGDIRLFSHVVTSIKRDHMKRKKLA